MPPPPFYKDPLYYMAAGFAGALVCFVGYTHQLSVEERDRIRGKKRVITDIIQAQELPITDSSQAYVTSSSKNYQQSSSTEK